MLSTLNRARVLNPSAAGTHLNVMAYNIYVVLYQCVSEDGRSLVYLGQRTNTWMFERWPTICDDYVVELVRLIPEDMTRAIRELHKSAFRHTFHTNTVQSERAFVRMKVEEWRDGKVSLRNGLSTMSPASS